MEPKQQRLIVIAAGVVCALVVFGGFRAFSIGRSDARQNARAVSMQEQDESSPGAIPPGHVQTAGEALAASGAIFTYRNGVVLATRDAGDLSMWARSQGTIVIGGGERAQSLNTDGDTYTKDRLITSGRIVPLEPMTKVDVLSHDDNVARVRVTGSLIGRTVNDGLEGYVDVRALYRSPGSSEPVPAFGR